MEEPTIIFFSLLWFFFSFLKLSKTMSLPRHPSTLSMVLEHTPLPSIYKHPSCKLSWQNHHNFNLFCHVPFLNPSDLWVVILIICFPTMHELDFACRLSVSILLLYPLVVLYDLISCSQIICLEETWVHFILHMNWSLNFQVDVGVLARKYYDDIWIWCKWLKNIQERQVQVRPLDGRFCLGLSGYLLKHKT